MLDIEVFTKKLINLRFWLLTEIKTIIWLFSISINFAIVTFVITELHIVCNICITQTLSLFISPCQSRQGSYRRQNTCPALSSLNICMWWSYYWLAGSHCSLVITGGGSGHCQHPQHDQYLVSVLETTSLMINIVYRSTQLTAHHCNITLVVLQSTYDSILLNQLKLSLLQPGAWSSHWRPLILIIIIVMKFEI